MSISKKIVIVDYGLGNLFGLKLSLEHVLSASEPGPVISSDPKIISDASQLILPGVGAFGDGMKNLGEQKLIGPIRDYAKSGKPLLGICLGMQLLMTEGEEFGVHEGLNLIPGRVIKFPEPKNADDYKIPNIGWRQLRIPSHRTDWSHSILAPIVDGAFMYFVHSYYTVPDNSNHSLAETIYGGIRYSSAITSGAIFGCQFHPEKSGEEGLGILRSFLSLNALPQPVSFGER